MQHDVGVVRSYASKSEIIHENDPADRVYEVISGAVCTSRTLREGRRQIAGFYFSGDVFGLESAEKQVLAAKSDHQHYGSGSQKISVKSIDVS